MRKRQEGVKRLVQAQRESWVWRNEELILRNKVGSEGELEGQAKIFKVICRFLSSTAMMVHTDGGLSQAGSALSTLQ